MMSLYFRDPKKELPSADELCLARHKIGVYIKCRFDIDKELFLEFNMSGCIIPWKKEFILGWMPISELDSVEIR